MNYRLFGNIRTKRNHNLLEFQVGGDIRYFQAKKVVYGLPRNSILKIDQPGASLSTPQARKDILSVRPITAFKFYLAFDTPWWYRFNISRGSMHMSVPAKQLYYWGVENEEGGDPSNTNSIIQVYDDSAAASFWSEMLKDEPSGVPFYLKYNRWAPQPQLIEDPSTHRSRMVEELMRQIRTVHSDPTIPDPYAAIFADWSREPFGAAFHFWNVDANAPEIRKRLRNPTKDETYVCGDTYSDEQGWVEGSLRSCEKMLIEAFGVQSSFEEYLQCA